jgi:hypothetical protein
MIDNVSVMHCGCGDGVVAGGEECDAGNRNGYAGGCCDAYCQFHANGDGCTDGSECTYDEVCTDGVCGGGKPVNCNDGNFCTDDSCEPQSGCVHDPNTMPCRVGNCRAGMCAVDGKGGSGGAAGAGSGGTEDGGEGGSPEGGTGTGARGGTVSEGGEGGEAMGGTSPRGGSNTGGTGLTSGSSGDPGGEGGEGVGGPVPSPKRVGNSGCGCRLPGKSSRNELPALLVLVLGAGIVARRRTRSGVPWH